MSHHTRVVRRKATQGFDTAASLRHTTYIQECAKNDRFWLFNVDVDRKWDANFLCLCVKQRQGGGLFIDAEAALHRARMMRKEEASLRETA